MIELRMVSHHDIDLARINYFTYIIDQSILKGSKNSIYKYDLFINNEPATMIRTERSVDGFAYGSKTQTNRK